MNYLTFVEPFEHIGITEEQRTYLNSFADYIYKISNEQNVASYEKFSDMCFRGTPFINHHATSLLKRFKNYSIFHPYHSSKEAYEIALKIDPTISNLRNFKHYTCADAEKVYDDPNVKLYYEKWFGNLIELVLGKNLKTPSFHIFLWLDKEKDKFIYEFVLKLKDYVQNELERNIDIINLFDMPKINQLGFLYSGEYHNKRKDIDKVLHSIFLHNVHEPRIFTTKTSQNKLKLYWYRCGAKSYTEFDCDVDKHSIKLKELLFDKNKTNISRVRIDYEYADPVESFSVAHTNTHIDESDVFVEFIKNKITDETWKKFEDILNNES